MLSANISLSGKSVVVVGACGFIGSHVVDMLLAHDCKVTAISRNTPGLIPPHVLENKNILLVNVDMRDKKSLINTFQDSDIVIHLASSSLPSTSNLDPQADVETNLIGSLNIFQACLENNVSRLIIVSSGGTVYGLPDSTPINENHSTNPICSYGVVKLAIEKYAYLYQYLHNLNTIVLRLANPYGERQRLNLAQGVIPAFLSRAINNQAVEIWGDGSTIRDFIYISDVVDAIKLACIFDGLENTFNIGSGTGLTLNQLINIISEVQGNQLKVIYKMPRKFDVPTNVLSIEHAKKFLGWKPKISAYDGIMKYYRYLKLN